MSTPAIPNFFIVGAPKCGTTALDHYLSQHPDVFIPEAKELQFFGSDIDTAETFIRSRDRFNVDERTYLRYFEGTRGQRAIGESTVWYLYSKTAANEIHEFNRNARIIIMLRDPVDAMVSLHQQHLYDLNEDVDDFKEAIEAETDRAAGRRMPENCYWPASLQYRAIYDYPDQVQRYLDVFGRDRVHIVLFDDFVADTAAAYRGVLEFLQVDYNYTPIFEAVNVSKSYRSRWLQQLSVSPPSFVRTAAAPILRVPFLRRLARATLRSLNSRTTDRVEIDRALRSELLREFSPRIQMLEESLDLDLSAWHRH